jgi:hypothetical protein
VKWEEERFIRLYTRDTPTWADLPWQARVVFYELLRKVTWSGRIAVGKAGLRGLSRTLMLPLHVVEAGLAALVDDGAVTHRDADLVLPNFQAAQTAKVSAVQRKRLQRERSAPEIVTQRDQMSRGVTESHAACPDVTQRDFESHGVTISQSEADSVTQRDAMSRHVTISRDSLAPAPARALEYSSLLLPNVASPSQKEEEEKERIVISRAGGNISSDAPGADAPDFSQGVSPSAEPATATPEAALVASLAEIRARAASADTRPSRGRPRGATKAPDAKASPEAREVFDHWVTRFKKRAVVLSHIRVRAIQGRLDEGYSVERLKLAIEGCAQSAWHVQERQTDIELICRNAVKTDGFLARVETAEIPDAPAAELPPIQRPPPREPPPLRSTNGQDRREAVRVALLEAQKATHQ